MANPWPWVNWRDDKALGHFNGVEMRPQCISKP